MNDRRPSDGTIRIVADDADDDVVRDGEHVRTPLFLIDTVDSDGRFVRGRAVAGVDLSDHCPDYRFATEDAREATRDAYDQMVARARDAWRTPPVRDGAEPDPEEVVMRRHLYGKPGSPDPGDVHALRGEQAEGERDRAWARYRDNLANAWKTNPRAAVCVEGRLERERGSR